MKQIFSYLIPYRARMALGFSIKVAATIVDSVGTFHHGR